MGFTAPELKSIVRQIVAGLAFCHSQRVMHRDLKPQNILVSGRDPSTALLKIGDLGCSKYVKRDDGFAQTQVGTPYYMSPEVWNNQPYVIDDC